MATTTRGHGGSSWRSTSGKVGIRSTGGTSSRWSKTSTGDKRSNTCSTSKCKPAAGVPAGYKQTFNAFATKINSYKTLCNQTRGAAKYPRPTKATLNSFANWINKGAVIQTVSCAQVGRWARISQKNFNAKNPTVASCKNVLTQKFGKTVIKAVARTKTGSFMVCTSPTWKSGKSFCFPK